MMGSTNTASGIVRRGKGWSSEVRERLLVARFVWDSPSGFWIGESADDAKKRDKLGSVVRYPRSSSRKKSFQEGLQQTQGRGGAEVPWIVVEPSGEHAAQPSLSLRSARILGDNF